MRMRPWLPVAMALAMAGGSLLLATGAAADTVTTKDELTLKGRVLSEGQDKLVLRTPYGELAIPKGGNNAIHEVALSVGS